MRLSPCFSPFRNSRFPFRHASPLLLVPFLSCYSKPFMYLSCEEILCNNDTHRWTQMRPKGSVLTDWPASSARRSKDILTAVISVHTHLSCEKVVYNNDLHRIPNSERVPSFFAELRATNAELRTKNVLPFSFHLAALLFLSPFTLSLAPCSFNLVPCAFYL